MRRFFSTLCLAGLIAGSLSMSFVNQVQAQSFSPIQFAPGRESLQPFHPGRRYRQFFHSAPPVAPFYSNPAVSREFGAPLNGWTAFPPGSVARWPVQNLPLTVFIASGDDVPGYRSSFGDLAIQALREWSQVSAGKLKFQLVTNPYDADITLGWESSAPGNEEMLEAGNTLTTASINSQTGNLVIKHARIMILTQVRGVPFSANELKKIVLHEIGHAIGIKEHSPVPTDIMFAVTSPAQQPTLSARDISSVNQIYRNYPVANL